MMIAARFMSSLTEFVRPTESVRTADRIMARNGAQALPVVTEDGRLAGLIHREAAAAAKQNAAVDGFMSKRVICCRPSDTIESVIATFNSCQIDVLVVTDDDGAFRGVLSAQDAWCRRN
ncbi:MAG: CBS domain-containing protein [Deltaproteobacteria bacterium]|nr:CBS domain-containing protein [Deltaproteobacteria bacterium]